MKKIIIILLFISTSIFANELKTINTYKEALKIAKSENKQVLFVTTVKTCPVCAYMRDIVYEREKVLSYLNENFVVVLKDVDNNSYPKRFHTRDMPTFYFINADTEKESREKHVGGAKPEKFLNILKIAMGEETSSTQTDDSEEGYEDDYCTEDEEYEE